MYDEEEARMDGGERGERGDDAGFPIKEHIRGEPIPDLDRMPREQWARALATLSPRQEEHQLQLLSIPGEEKGQLMLDIWDVRAERRRAQARIRGAADGGPVVPAPSGAGTPRGPARAGHARQVSMRLHPREYADLAAVAAALGAKPTQLARQLVLNGVRRMRFEEQRMADG